MIGFRIQKYINGYGLIGPDEKVWHTARSEGALKDRCTRYQKAFDLGRRHDTIEYGRRVESKIDPRVQCNHRDTETLR